MGKPTGAADTPSNPNSITHFSHPHPLHLSNPQTLPQIAPCSACKLDTAAAAVYACISCNFALHPKCSQLPQQITHPFDAKHALTLYPKPVYPEGLFNCDGCGQRGAGFSYHCSPCGIDLHSTCASVPLSLTHHLHHHALSLTFSAPYAGNSFSCDICKKLGSKTWLYRCAACEFDVHLTCVAAVLPPPHAITSSFSPNAGAYNYQGGLMAPQAYGGGNVLRDRIVVAAVEGVAGGVAQSATDALLQGIVLGGGGLFGAGNGMCVDAGAGAATIDYYAAADGGSYSAADESY